MHDFLTDLTRPEPPQALPALELLLLPARNQQWLSRIRGRGGHRGQRRGRDGERVQLAAAATLGDVRLGEDHSGELRMRGVVLVQGAL